MNPNKALWEKGDFTQIADCMRQSGRELVESLSVGPGMQILDLGCGDGTTALPAAQMGADVTGVDIAANLVAAGNARAKAAGLDNLRFEEGDASNLENIPADAFDMVVSIFGAMFAPRPHDVAREMVRVTKSGGRIVMGNWIPGDPTLIAQVLKTSAAYTPPPPEGFISPVTWGQEAHVIERFTQTGVPSENISYRPATYTFRHDGPPSEFLAKFRNWYGPTMNAFEAAARNGKADQLQAELEELFNVQNTSDDPGKTLIPATYLQVEVRVP